jgi:D-glycero-D-manno-heptose 1,7-bisphosphate phosphatase
MQLSYDYTREVHMHKLICLDVDGTLVQTASGATFRKAANDWMWLPRRRERCLDLYEQGVLLAIITNQAGVAFPWSSFTEAEMQHEIEIVARAIHAECCVRVCYSTPSEVALKRYYNPDDKRRKPGPDMIIEAMQYYALSPSDTLMVGDRPEDNLAAQAAGVQFKHAEQFFGGA